MKSAQPSTMRKKIIGASMLAATVPFAIGGVILANNASAEEVYASIYKTVKYNNDQEANGRLSSPPEETAAAALEDCKGQSGNTPGTYVQFATGTLGNESNVTYIWACAATGF